MVPLVVEFLLRLCQGGVLDVGKLRKRAKQYADVRREKKRRKKLAEEESDGGGNGTDEEGSDDDNTPLYSKKELQESIEEGVALRKSGNSCFGPSCKVGSWWI